MDEVSLVDHSVSEVFAQVLRGAKVDPSTPQDSRELSLEPGKSEEAHGHPQLELNQHIYVALGPEIRTQYRTEERKLANSVPCAEFDYSFIADFNRWRHLRTSGPSIR
jgi:hypothetical protein